MRKWEEQAKLHRDSNPDSGLNHGFWSYSMRPRCYLMYHTNTKRRFSAVLSKKLGQFIFPARLLRFQFSAWLSDDVRYFQIVLNSTGQCLFNLYNLSAAFLLLSCHRLELKLWCLPTKRPLKSSSQIQQCTSSYSSTAGVDLPPTKKQGSQESKAFLLRRPDSGMDPPELCKQLYV